MTCAQGLLRLLWGGGPKLECYGTAGGIIFFGNLTTVIFNLSRKLYFSQ